MFASYVNVSVVIQIGIFFNVAIKHYIFTKPIEKQMKIKKMMIFTAVITLVIAVSCRKEIGGYLNDSSADPGLLAIVKPYYAQKADLTTLSYRKLMSAEKTGLSGSKVVPGNKPFWKIAPLWDQAFELRSQNGDQLLVVPTKENKLATDQFSIRRVFVFTVKEGKAINGEILEILTEGRSLNNELNNIIIKSQGDHSGFTGAIMRYDLNYFPISGQAYKNGAVVQKIAQLVNLPRAQTSTSVQARTADQSGGGSSGSGSGCQELYYCYGNANPGDTGCTFIGYSDGCFGSGGSSSGGGSSGGGSTSGGTGGGGPYGGNEQPNAEFYRDTDITRLKPCMQTVFNDIKRLNGSIPAMIKAFTPDGPDYKWTLKDGILAENKNGETNIDDAKMATTIIDGSKFTEATNLAIARTIMHEAIHAYLVSYFKNDPINAQKEYAGLVDAWAEKQGWEHLNEVHHTYFVKQFIDPMISALTEYGAIAGIGFPSNLEKTDFYDRLAWGGLTETKAFDALSAERKEKVKQTLMAEQFGKDLNGNTTSQQGRKGGCK
jgi:hypothetical protein